MLYEYLLENCFFKLKIIENHSFFTTFYKYKRKYNPTFDYILIECVYTGMCIRIYVYVIH